ncbi:MAG: ABC transporter ATP-binding protein [Parachlamydiaceae bacterium]|nr:ABC transporter ATP-binding protein [Parachlamydiaceae bacterium]
MKKLFKIAFKSRQYLILLGIMVILMCLSTVASQVEVFSLGVITKSGPGFFELFGTPTSDNGTVIDVVTQKDLLQKWNDIDPLHTGEITIPQANAYLSEKKGRDIIASGISFINQYLPISGNLTNLAIMLVCVALFKAVALFSHRFTTRLVAIRISRDLRLQYFEHLQTLPMSFFHQHSSGALSSRVVGDAALIAEAVNACLVNYLQTPFTVITTLTLCFFTSWKLSLIIFFGFPLIVMPIIFLAKKVKRISKQIQQNQERFASVLIDFLSGIQTVKIFAMEAFSMEKYREFNTRMAHLEQRSAKYDLASRPIIHSIGMFFLATALVYGIYVLQMSASEVFFYCGLLYIFYEPIKKFAEENSHIQRGIAAAERMYEVMDLPPQIEDSPSATSLSGFNDKIEFKDVWFRYGDNWVLKGLNLTINKGESVAIVGPTGAGKSTIAQLLPRLYDIQQGEISIDGKSLACFTQKSLRENIAFVPQKPFLFLDTIAKNIGFGRDFSMQEIEIAAGKAHADEFIEKLVLGYQTELVETGKNLSGGQQQRLAIARALVKDAPILVMDEATSSLDNVSENRIKNAIRDLHGKVTQIIIAHRLSTIEDADRIVYIEDGEKIAEGTKDELLASCVGFKLMWDTMHRQKPATKE